MIPTFGIGGGMLQLPATGDRELQRQYSIVALDGREWAFIGGGKNAIELRGRILIHDYAVFHHIKDEYDEAEMDTRPNEGWWALALFFSPFAAANYEASFGFARHLGELTPRPYFRGGASLSLLLRVSDPDHRVDMGFGAYAGLGMQISEQWALRSRRTSRGR